METIMEIKLNWEVVEDMDLTGFNFYVKEGDLFDFGAYCEAYNVNPQDFDQHYVKGAQDAAGRLTEGQFLRVYHEV